MEINHRASKIVIITAGLVMLVAILASSVNVLQMSPVEQQVAAQNLEQVVDLPESEPVNAVENIEPDEVISTAPKKSSIDLTKLPLGNNKNLSFPKVGYIYSCQTSFSGGGAFKPGPWIDETAGVWDLTKKVKVDGSVIWPKAKFTDVMSHGLRMLTTNSLPSHVTGKYPISYSDDAYKYDRNPNSIKTNDISVNLQADPVLLDKPECVGGEVGILLSGIALFNGFDAGGRDAMAMEVQDQCNGHPQSSGLYHYHGVSNCLADSGPGNHSKLFGYALDGFGIFGVKGEGGVVLSTNDLDECHGHTHEINWNGAKKVMYHYHLTYDFPYSVSCFRAQKAVKGPLGNSVAPTFKPPVGPAPPDLVPGFNPF